MTSDGVTERAEADPAQAQAKDGAQAAAARQLEMAWIEDQIRAEVRRQHRQHVDTVSQESALTDEERTRVAERGELEAWELMHLVERFRRDVAGRTEEELIAEVPRNPQLNSLELTRRLIDSTRNLQVELVKSRESSEQVATDLGGKMTELTSELVKFRKSSDDLTKRVLWWSRAVAALTVVLAVGTGILIYLTMVLVQRTPPSPAVSTPPATRASPTTHPAGTPSTD